MPAEWLYIAGGIFIAMLVFVIAYNLLTMQMIQAQKQNALADFNDLLTDIETVCLQEINNSMFTKINIPTSVRVLYVTDDTKNPLAKVVENITNEQINVGKNICLQFIDEQIIRCKELTCNTTMPYMGSLPEYMDIKIMVKKILGEALVKQYSLLIVKTGGDKVIVATGEDLPVVPEGIVPPITTTTITTTTSIAGTTTIIPSGCSAEDLANLVDVNTMIVNIEELTENPRPYGSSWNEETAVYIKNKLELYELENVHFEDFEDDYGSSGKNVVGEVGTGSNVIVVAGGHRDSVSEGPGAVDNAAGTVTVMEAARVLASCKNNIKNNKIRFVLFDGEEEGEGLLGSYAYVAQHYTEIDRMLNFDCLGLKGNSGLTIIRNDEDLAKSADKACLYLGINCDRRTQAFCESDFCPFALAGKKYLWAINYGYTCGDSCYHRSCDDIRQIGNEQMEWAGKFAVYVIADLYLR